MVLVKACSQSVGFPCVYCLIETMGMIAGMSKEDGNSPDSQTDWEAAWKALLWSFAAASVYTLLASWVPAIHSFPVASWLGMRVVTDWGWEVTPSMGYIGQGMIMGPKTAFSMLAGAVVGTLHDHFLYQMIFGKSNYHILPELCLLLAWDCIMQQDMSQKVSVRIQASDG